MYDHDAHARARVVADARRMAQHDIQTRRRELTNPRINNARSTRHWREFTQLLFQWITSTVKRKPRPDAHEEYTHV